MKRSKLFVVLSFVIMMLAGCGSTTKFDQSSLRPDVDMLAGVQRAVNEYREDTGVLPIKTRDQETDIFIKYLIDFDNLVTPCIHLSVSSSEYQHIPDALFLILLHTNLFWHGSTPHTSVVYLQ